MNAVVPVPDKITALIPRLGSDKDGEVVATVHAIRRQLAKAGMDLHDLTARLSAAPVIVMSSPDRGPILSHWRVAVQWISSHPGWEPNERERQFISDMHRILKRDAPTERQAEWIAGIVERLGGRMDV